MEFEDLLARLNQLIVVGRLGEVQQQLKKMKNQDIPRKYLAEFANIGWRSGLPTYTIQILKKYVRPIKGTLLKSTPREAMEYAAALNRLGAFQEARDLLATLKPEEFPKKCLYEGFISMSRWEYDLAVEPLLFYQRTLKSDQYDWAVTTVNLAASLIVLERFEEAKDYLDRVIVVLSEQKRLRLLANAYELLSQIYVRQQNMDEAFSSIKKGESLIGDKDYFEALFFKKWGAIASVYSKPHDVALENLRKVQKEAARMQHWETLRECDLYECYLTRDSDLFNKLYFGTPYKLYRNRICRTLLVSPPTENSCWWPVNPEEGSKRRHLDCLQGTFEDHPFIDSLGSVYHRLLLVLMGDLYRPTRLTTLHSELYPGQYYDLDSTPNKLYQVLMRLRQDVERSKVPFKIDFIDSNLFLKFLEPLRLQLHLNYKSSSRISQILKLHFPEHRGEPISSAQLAQKMGCSQRQAQRLLNQAREEGLIESANGPSNQFEKKTSRAA